MGEYTPNYWDAYWKESGVKFNKRHEYMWGVLQKYIRPDSKLLDIGIGPGVFYENTPAHKMLVGIDISVEGLKKTQQKRPDGIYICCDGHKIPIIDNCFDVTLLMGMVNYWPYDWGYLLNEARRLTRNEGHIAVSVLSGWQGQIWDKEKIEKNLKQFGEVMEITETKVWQLGIIKVKKIDE